MNKSFLAKPVLEKIDAHALPERHPVRRLVEIYESERSKLPNSELPRQESIMPRCGEDLLSYCLIMEPVEGDPYLDFMTQRKGSNIPGIETATVVQGEMYSERLEPSLVEERLMELASCVVLKAVRLSQTTSARPSTLDVKVYRGVFPIWQAVRQTSAVILMIAPIYAEV